MVGFVAKASKNHSGASLVEGTWTCAICGSESMDFELFEEVGEQEDCLARGVAAGTIQDPNDLVTWAEVERVRKQMEDVKGQMQMIGSSAEKVGVALGRMRTDMRKLMEARSPHYSSGTHDAPGVMDINSESYDTWIQKYEDKVRSRFK